MNEEHFGPMFHRLSIMIRRTIDAKIMEYGINSSQSHILFFVYYESQNRELYQKDIEDEFKIRKSSVSSVMLTMEKNQLIERISSEKDARLKRVVVTEKGASLVKQLEKEIQEFDQQLKSVLSESQRDNLVTSIHLLTDYLITNSNDKKEDIC